MQVIPSVGYTIHTGQRALKELDRFVKKGTYSRVFVLCDENTMKHCLPVLIAGCPSLKEAEVFEIESGERSKSLVLCSQIWETLIDYKAGKDALIVNLGGGVISDFGGFVASVYKRGIDFVNVPTSLLAMADASVGGKTGVDFANVKNALGTITQPKGVFVVYDFLKTLPSRHVYNGLAEIYKVALISDKTFWNKISGVVKENDRDAIIYRSIQLKNNIVKKDPAEKKLRKALNFGHSIGHAVESALLGKEDELLHGEAVIVGMICAAWLSLQKKLIDKTTFASITDTLIRVFDPRPLPPGNEAKILAVLQNDKKNRKGQFLFVLLNGIGKHKIDVMVTERQVNQSLQFYNSLFK